MCRIERTERFHMGKLMNSTSRQCDEDEVPLHDRPEKAKANSLDPPETLATSTLQSPLKTWNCNYDILSNVGDNKFQCRYKLQLQLRPRIARLATETEWTRNLAQNVLNALPKLLLLQSHSSHQKDPQARFTAPEAMLRGLARGFLLVLRLLVIE